MPNDHGIDDRPGASPQRDELARELDAAIESGRSESEALHGAVARFVASARARGLPPQEVIVALKEELRHHAMPRLRQDSYTSLSEHVVQWGIDEYYGR
jgi:hypothetical protein